MMKSRFAGLLTKEAEIEHYDFLNEMRVRLNIDTQKLIDLEARITGQPREMCDAGRRLGEHGQSQGQGQRSYLIPEPRLKKALQLIN